MYIYTLYILYICNIYMYIRYKYLSVYLSIYLSIYIYIYGGLYANYICILLT